MKIQRVKLFTDGRRAVSFGGGNNAIISPRGMYCEITTYNEFITGYFTASSVKDAYIKLRKMKTLFSNPNIIN